MAFPTDIPARPTAAEGGVRPYYSDENVTLYCGDCRDVLTSADLGRFDLLATDPPYNVSGQHRDEHRLDGSLRRLNFAWDLLPLTAIIERLGLACDLLRSPANAIVFCGHTQAAAIDELLIGRGMSTKPVAWVKQCPPPSFGTTRWASAFELGVFGFHAGATWNLRESGMRPNVIVADALRHGNAERTGHETQKPLAVMRWAMEPTTKPGQRVLDPFCGSGTTLELAVKLGLYAVGIEKSEEHCERVVNRLRQGDLYAGARAAS